MGNDPIFLTNLNLAYVVGRTDRSPCQRTQRWNTSKVCLLAVLITTLSWVVEENTKSSWARSRAQLQALMIFMALLGVRELVWATKKNTQENTTMSCLIHFVGRIWHLLKPLRQPNWLLLKLHTPGSALAVSGGAIWSRISLGRIPKKNPNVTTFWVSFLKPLRNLCCRYVGSKWGPEKYPKLLFLRHLRPC